jgi:hypothetical protein
MNTRRNLTLGGMLIIAACGCGKKDAPPATDQSATPGAAAAVAPSSSAPASAPAAAALAFLSKFEGEVDLSMTNSAQKPPRTDAFTLLVKDGKARVDIPDKLGAGAFLGSGAYVIFDAAAKKVELVSDAQKQVFVVDLNTSGEKLKALAGSHHPTPPGHEKPKGTLTKTGKFDTVAGHKCENWDVVTDHREGTMCVEEEDASWFQIPLSGLPADQAWAAELLDGKHLPLRFVGYAKDGATESQRLEVVKIDKKALPAGEFEYPPTYTVSDFGQMFAGLAGMRGGMPGMPGGATGAMPGMPGRPFPNGMPISPKEHP